MHSTEYLVELYIKFENTSACLSGAQMFSNHEKNGDRKSRDTLIFKPTDLKSPYMKLFLDLQ